jgi:hypothetical protein
MQYRFLGIGVNAAPRATTLQYAESDTVRVLHVLTGSLGPLADGDASCLLGAEATSVRVLQHLAVLARQPPDVLLLFFGGHGNETGIALSDRLLSYDELGRALFAIRSRIKVAVLNTCHAGAGLRQLREGATRIGGVANLEHLWSDVLAAASPGLRVYAAVAEDGLAHEDPTIRGGRFVSALLWALEYAHGDILHGGASWISDLRAFETARDAIASRWPDEGRPMLLRPSGPCARFPMVLAQADHQIGTARIRVFRPIIGVGAELTVDLSHRRHVATRSRWAVEDRFGREVVGGAVVLCPVASHQRVVRRLLAWERISNDPLIATELASRGEALLRWRVALDDNHHRELDSAAFAHTFRIPRAPTVRSRRVW